MLALAVCSALSLVSTGAASSPAKLEQKQLEALWAELASADAPAAYRALLTLARRPGEAVTFVQQHLKPVPAPDRKRIAQLINDLGSDRYAERTKAARDLERLGDLAEPDLHKALAGSPTLEIRRRLEQIVMKLDARRDPVTSPKLLQSLRAVELLEYIATPQANAVLAKVADGFSGARLTQEAKETLERLKKLAVERSAGAASDSKRDKIQADSSGDRLPPGVVLRLGMAGNGQLVDYITYSPDGRTLAVAGEDISVWDVRTGKLLTQVQPKANPLALTFSPRSKLAVLSVARGGDWGKPRTTWLLETWDPTKPGVPQTRSWESAGHPPEVAAISPDGKLLAAGSYGAVTIWHLVIIKELRRLEMKYVNFDTLVMSPDGSLVAGGSDDRHEIMLSKWLTGQAERLPRGDDDFTIGSAAAVLFSPTGKWALGRRGRRLQVINLASKTWAMPLAVKENRWSLPAISPDGRSIAVATGDFENRIELWEKATGKKRLSLAGFDPRVRSLAFSPDNRDLAAGLNDGTTLIWDLVHLPLQPKAQHEKGRN